MVVTTTMHAKSDSETSIDASTPPRSPRRPLYYVQSPSHSQQHDLEKMSYGSSPFGSPVNQHYQYHCSPIHHSRESSTSRFSASLKNPKSALGWKRISGGAHHQQVEDEEDDDDDHDDGGGGQSHKAQLRFYVVCFLVCFVILFSVFSLILWAASVPYKPKIFVKNMVFENFNVQAGTDATGVPTDMLTLNSTVRIFFRNPATFFGVHVTATPLKLHFYDLQVASGEMKKFYQSRKSQRMVAVVVKGHQVPLYGGVPALSGAKGHLASVTVPLNLTFTIRSRAYILGRLVKPKFYSKILCQVTLRHNNVGKPIHLMKSENCIYR